MTRPPRLRLRRTPPRPPIRSAPHPAIQPDPIPSRASSPWNVAASPFRAAYRWYQRVDWVRHTTVVAALVAAVGLGVTAWGTLKSAQVADDQLAQSREQAELDAMDQASRVSVWAQGEDLVAVNYSLQVVTLWIVSNTKEGLLDTWPITRVPPCKEMTTALDDPYTEGLTETGPEALTKAGGDVKLAIVDARGKVWVQEPFGTLTPLEDRHFRFSRWHQSPIINWTTTKVKLRSLSGCGR